MTIFLLSFLLFLILVLLKIISLNFCNFCSTQHFCFSNILMFYVPDFLLTSPNQKKIKYRTKNTRNMTYYNIKKGKKNILEGRRSCRWNERGLNKGYKKKTIPTKQHVLHFFGSYITKWVCMCVICNLFQSISVYDLLNINQSQLSSSFF